MKYVLLFIVAGLFFSARLYSQAYDGTIDYDKKKQPAFLIDYPFPPEAVENAVIKKMEQLGYKGKEEKGLFNRDKGFRVYGSAFITDISSGSMDYVFKVEPKGRRDKDQSIVYMVILKDGENTKSSFDEETTRKAKSFLNNLQPLMEEANLELQIRGQEEALAKAEKKLSNLRDDQQDMEKKIKKLQEDLADNAKDQEDQQKEIEAQQKLLEELKGKRKTSSE
jgi:hypothetical protein